MKETRISNLERLIEQGNTLVANSAVGTTTADLWKTVAVGESVRSNAHAFSTAVNSAGQAYAAVYGGKPMSHAAQVASAMILSAMGNEEEFMSKPARESSDKRWNNYMEVAIPGQASLNADYGKTPLVATEYYTNKDLDKNLGLTWTLNVRALETQSAFAEKLFPTITVDTNDVGITVRTKITTVTRGILNALLAKDSVIDDRKPLHNALTDHTVLQDDAIRIVPYVMEDGDNAEYFVSDDIIENETVRLGRVPPYPTNYLDISKLKGNLFRLAAHPGIVAEGYDETDEIAPGAALGSLLVSVRKPGDDVKAGKKIILNTRDMQFASFQRPPEGDGRELVLQFRRTQFALNGDSLDYKGDDIPALSALKQSKYTLRYVINITMSLFTNGQRSGQYEISGANLSIEDLVDATGAEVSMDSGIGKTIMDNLKIELLGWRFDGTRTNENRRTQGLLLDPVWEQENYKLQYGSPIMTKQPVGVEYDDAERLDDLVSAVNIRNEMLAITQTLSYTDAVKQAKATMVTQWDKTAIRGLGRHWVAPWYEEVDFNVDKIVQSLETKDALINARQALLQRIADQVTRAIQDSRYMPALRLLTANPQAVPKVVIATDEPTAAMLLLQVGETRLLGDRYDYEVVTTNDDRWRIKNEADGSWTRRLQWVLKVDGVEEGSYCVLNWGNHFWSPIMVTNINIQRNGSTSKELAVQPRNAHICHCPITGLIWVKGITKLVEQKLAYNVVTTQSGDGATAGGNAGDVAGDAGTAGVTTQSAGTSTTAPKS
ncbi:major head protein [Erwinia phage Machina]|uniref:Putative major capsid protein n=2 Tax=Machinavirus machina TaxID=2169990 RepID=A0A1B2ID35_9CAUD|nr:major head protein [Erwinia phage vB_EamM_Huxley]YP_009617003.1 major head protein [Erwinia phage Machina]ANZ49169.1 putative major capsid protein [Erwinia phage vB_EamM_Huxley]ANZ49724.1 putative major capsid protein [Erwinia phage Machina]